jgi:hypothetical protein
MSRASVPPANGPPRTEIRLRPDTSFGLQTTFDLFGIGPDRFAKGGNFVNKRDGERQKRIERMFGHLRRFDPHPLDPVGKRPEHLGHAWTVGVGANPHNDAIRLREDVNRLAESEIFRGISEGDRPVWKGGGMG